MKERPILFSREMVNAILEGRKTQTRRALKHQPRHLFGERYDGIDEEDKGLHYFELLRQNGSGSEVYEPYKCPYGAVGDRLWVRETCNISLEKDAVMYLDYGGKLAPHAKKGSENHCREWKTCPSIHMPRWTSRINLEVKRVRVERLNDISEEDAEAEGAPEIGGRRVYPSSNAALVLSHCKGFQKLWESINGAGSWELNPWVWVIEFEKI